jgi:hypothetical protein
VFCLHRQPANQVFAEHYRSKCLLRFWDLIYLNFCSWKQQRLDTTKQSLKEWSYVVTSLYSDARSVYGAYTRTTTLFRVIPLIKIHGKRPTDCYEAVNFLLKCSIAMHGTALAAYLYILTWLCDQLNGNIFDKILFQRTVQRIINFNVITWVTGTA